MNRCSDCEYLHGEDRQHPFSALCTRYPMPQTDYIIEGKPDQQQPYMRCRDVRKGLPECPFFKRAKGPQTEIDL